MNLAQRAAIKWLGDLIHLVSSGETNDLLVKRIQRDTQTLLDKQAERPEMCWLVLAFAAFLQGDRDACVRYTDAAYALAKQDTMILGNIASLLGNMGEARLAAYYAQRLHALSIGDPKLAIHAARVLCTALHLEGAAQVMGSPGVRSALEKHASMLEQDEILRSIDDTLALFHSAGVDADLRMSLLESSVMAVRSKNYAISQVMPILYAYDGTMRYELFVNAPRPECAELSFVIAEALVDKFDDAYPDLITFSCRSLTSYRSRMAGAEACR